jgi:hypothetical protein
MDAHISTAQGQGTLKKKRRKESFPTAGETAACKCLLK